MRIQFFGVRGSVATAGAETQRYGGNTSCLVVEAGGETLIFDAGTGIRKLGCALGPVGVNAHLFLSHLHWDHIQGFPFFTPAYVPGNQLTIHGVAPAGGTVRDVFAQQMTAPTFPVSLDVMRADLRFIDIPEEERIVVGRAKVRWHGVDHPNGCVAYRVDHGGKSVVYATDLEHRAGVIDDGLVELAQGADLLIYDAMYTPEEYDGVGGFSRKGWGHSTFAAGAEVAVAASVKKLALFHHDPSHDDGFMDALVERAQKTRSGTLTDVFAAQEGHEVVL